MFESSSDDEDNPLGIGGQLSADLQQQQLLLLQLKKQASTQNNSVLYFEDQLEDKETADLVRLAEEAEEAKRNQNLSKTEEVTSPIRKVARRIPGPAGRPASRGSSGSK